MPDKTNCIALLYTFGTNTYIIITQKSLVAIYIDFVVSKYNIKDVSVSINNQTSSVYNNTIIFSCRWYTGVLLNQLYLYLIVFYFNTANTVYKLTPHLHQSFLILTLTDINTDSNFILPIIFHVLPI